MNSKKQLFQYQYPYDLERTEEYFLAAVKENILFQIKGCKEYARIAEGEHFHISQIKSVDDLWKIPVIPTLYFKSHHLFSLDQSQYKIHVTSSGTKGNRSVVNIDKESLKCGISMAYTMFFYHKLISVIPAHYMMLGYEPDKNNTIGAVKTADGATRFAPAVSKSYVLIKQGEEYRPNIPGVLDKLYHYAKGSIPIRFMGFPAYLSFLLDYLEKEKIHVTCPKGSRVLLGGGWKQFDFAKADARILYERVWERLGIPKSHCHEFFSAVEHPVMYCTCKHHHFHVPIYSRVIIRSCETLEPLGFGKMGLLSFVTPIMRGMPLVSVVTDDLAVLHEGGDCGCSISSPWFEVIGRTGVDGIVTCAADAAKWLGGGL